MLFALSTFAAEDDSTERDYSEELPRIDPLEPEDSLKSFSIAPGFRIEQVAAEPLVVDPVAMSFDENGRLFVIEMRDYSEQENESLGRVRRLEDSDGDGRFDKSTVYAEGLSWPTAIHCWGGGVYVAAAPDLIFLEDTGGDGRADERRIVFTGFQRSNVQGLVNSLRWGLDNRIHGATSSSGASLTKPGRDAEPLVLRGRDFSFDPRTEEVAPTSGGGQHGLSFDAWGNKFVCSNSNHIQQVMFEDRYIARNPYLAVPSPRVSIAADGPQADVFRTSPVEPWRVVRTRLRVKGVVPGPVEGGGRPAGYFTGATGVTIYKGGEWPAEYRGLAIVGDVGSNLVHRKRLQRRGLEFTARRIDERSELLTSSDIWFRPVQFANAPDGGLYVLDMYREVIEHPKSLPPVIKQHLDLTSGRDRGRIYRIVSESFEQPEPPRVGDLSTAELAALLGHENGWQRETAARLLHERRDPSAVPLLEEQAAGHASPLGRLHALYALDGLQALTPEVVLTALEDEHAEVRRHAVRLSETAAGDSPQVREKLLAMAGDEDVRVRYQLAFSLGELSGAARYAALARLARQDVDNPWLLPAVQSSLKSGAGEVLAELSRDDAFAKSKPGLTFLKSLAVQIGKQQNPEDVAALLAALPSLQKSNEPLLTSILTAMEVKPGSPLARQIADATGGRSEELTAELIEQSAKDALNEELPLERRVSSVALLRLGKFVHLQNLFSDLLAPSQPIALQEAALACLASYADEQVAGLLLDRWGSFSPALRSQAGDVLFTRKAWLTSLLAALEDGRIPAGDIQPGRLKALAAHPDASLRERAAKLLDEAGFGRRGEVVEAWRDVLTMEGDGERGKALHKKVCAACHRVEGVGHELAPNLAAMRNRGPEAILINVLDPNREVNPEFVGYTLLTTDGRSLSGMISAETATSVTLRRADNQTDTVLRIDIDELKSTGLSLMPEGLEKDLHKQDLADLIAYLMGLEAAP